MASGNLVKLLLHTDVTKYLDFKVPFFLWVGFRSFFHTLLRYVPELKLFAVL